MPSPPGVSVYFPAGNYRVTSTLTFGDVGIRFLGDGQDISILKKTNSGTLLQGTYTSFYNGLAIVEGLTFATTVVNTGDAINISWPTASAIGETTADISDVLIRPEPTTASVYFTRGIVLDDAWFANIRNVQVHGHFASIASGTRGISLLNACVDVRVENVRVYAMEIGYEIGSGISQGVTYHRCTGVFCTYGMWINPGSVQPQVDVESCHFNTFTAGIILDYMAQSRVAGCLIYKNENSTNDWFGIFARNGSNDCRFIGNEIYVVSTSGANNGILVDASNCIVTGNMLHDAATAIWIVGGSNNIVTSNGRAGGTNTLVDQGTSTIAANNTP